MCVREKTGFGVCMHVHLLLGGQVLAYNCAIGVIFFFAWSDVEWTRHSQKLYPQFPSQRRGPHL